MALDPNFAGFCMAPRSAGGKEASQIIKNSKKPVLLMFHSPECGHCQEAKPVLQSVSCPYRDDVEVVSVNVDDAAELADEHKIESIPHIVSFKGGQKVEEQVGFDEKGGKERFQKMFEKLLD